MEDLRKMFESFGFTKVKTLLNSGNIVFDTEIKDVRNITQKIESVLNNLYKRDIRVIVRTVSDIQALVASDPFKGIVVASDTRLYITFLFEKPTGLKLRIPYESPKKDFKILRVTDTEAISVLSLSPGNGTIKAMDIIGKKFGKDVTTRNWNTVVKVAKV